ncbi:spore germination protein GerPC [Fredinandcohnia humi]
MYSHYYDISTYVRCLHQYIEQQDQRIARVEQLLQQMQHEVNELKNRPTTQIERIEYKFDQLKVETLEGTLNIGLNPLNSEQIEDFAVSQGKMNIPDIRHVHKQLIDEIQDHMDDYLTNECPSHIQSILTQRRTSIEEGHIEFIVEDIRKQINDRIVYYLEQHHNDLHDPSRESEIYQTIVYKLKNDIQNTVTAYLANLPNSVKEGKKS